jgi:hypothetical protein
MLRAYYEVVSAEIIKLSRIEAKKIHSYCLHE